MKQSDKPRKLIQPKIKSMQARLDKIASRKTKIWWERYLRNTIEFRGVNLVNIREVLHKWYKSEKIDALDLTQQLELALNFFNGNYAEDKLTGVLFLQDYLYNKIDWKILVPKFEKLFSDNLIYDWNVCDWFCVRVLGPMIKENGMNCAKAISKWHRSINVWQARASLIAFVGLTKELSYRKYILDSCENMIKREERFAKTAVGWVLRVLSKSDKKVVVSFLDDKIKYFSLESLGNTTKYFSTIEKKKYVLLMKSMNKKS
jgi:3-methyladenine DNA glycosylase AlkD